MFRQRCFSNSLLRGVAALLDLLDRESRERDAKLLQKRSESAISLRRAVTVPLPVKVLGRTRGSLDPTTALAARQIVLGALQDPDQGVRAFSVNALGSYGGLRVKTTRISAGRLYNFLQTFAMA
jgi:hypothetical protein